MKIETPFEVPEWYHSIFVLGIEGREIWIVVAGTRGIAYGERNRDAKGPMSKEWESKVLDWIAQTILGIREELKV